MKKKANLSLALLSFLFIISVGFVYLYPGQWWPRMLQYTFEAGLVGALADLFAITVLFRHPFGWKWVPHTAIIPKNRNKLVDGVVNMVENEILSKQMLKEKVEQIHIVEEVISWIERRSSGGQVAEQGWNLLSGFLTKLDLKEIAQLIDVQSRKGLSNTNVAPYAGKAILWTLEKGDFQGWLDKIVQSASSRASGYEVKRAIKKLLEKEKSKYINEGNSLKKFFKKTVVKIAESTDSLNLEEAADALYDDLQNFLRELSNPRHELRVLIEEMVYKLASNLQNRSDVSKAVNSWKDEVIERISLLPSIEALLIKFKDILMYSTDSKYFILEKNNVNSSDIREWISSFMQTYWEWFKSNESMKDWLEKYLKEFTYSIIDSEHSLIGQIVRKTLSNFTEQKLVHFIESKVEIDLQRIRVNGAFIGAALGALFFIVLQGVYKPLLNLFNS